MPPMMTQLLRQGTLPWPLAANVRVYQKELRTVSRSDASIHRVAVGFKACSRHLILVA